MIRDTLIVFRRQLRMNLRNPAWVLIGVMQPVLYLVLFGPLIRPLVGQFGADDAYAFLVPGLLIQLATFGGIFAGFGVIAEWREGVIESQKVTPVSRVALLVGRLLRDAVLLLVQSTILVALAYLLGMSAPVGGVVMAVGLTVLVGAACAAASDALALVTRSEDALAPILNFFSLPVLLLSGILLPMSLGPGWLQGLSNVMPFRWVVTACREAIAGNYSAQHLGAGLAVSLVLLALGVAWGAAMFRRDEA